MRIGDAERIRRCGVDDACRTDRERGSAAGMTRRMRPSSGLRPPSPRKRGEGTKQDPRPAKRGEGTKQDPRPAKRGEGTKQDPRPAKRGEGTKQDPRPAKRGEGTKQDPRPAKRGEGTKQDPRPAKRGEGTKRAPRPGEGGGGGRRRGEGLACIACERTYPLDQVRYTCDCGGLLEVQREAPRVDRAVFDARRASRNTIDQSGVWRFREAVLDVDQVVTHPEGGTHLYERNGLFFKHEGENPTGSFKDRGMTVAVTQAVRLGAKAIACASTGNTSASLAAYAAQAGLKAIVFVPSGKISGGKLAQTLAYGATVLQVRGDFDAAMRPVRSE